MFDSSIPSISNVFHWRESPSRTLVGWNFVKEYPRTDQKRSMRRYCVSRALRKRPRTFASSIGLFRLRIRRSLGSCCETSRIMLLKTTSRKSLSTPSLTLLIDRRSQLSFLTTGKGNHFSISSTHSSLNSSRSSEKREGAWSILFTRVPTVSRTTSGLISSTPVFAFAILAARGCMSHP